jgi:acyl-CoA thioester hydrolase
MRVREEWTDYNGHLNMAYYQVLFDRGCDEVFDHLGIGAAYAHSRRLTIYTAETHVCYLRELHAGATVRCSFRLLDYDEKRLHAFQEMHHADGWLAATCELLSLHVDMSGPTVVAFPADIMPGIQALAAAHAGLAWPERAGRVIAIKRSRA